MTLGIQEIVALLVLGGAVGGFTAELIRRRKANGNTGIIEAVLADSSQTEDKLLVRMDTLSSELYAQRARCDERLEKLEELTRHLGRRLEECLSRVEGERRPDVHDA